MINLKNTKSILIFTLFLLRILFNNAALLKDPSKKSRSDDEDGAKSMQSSGDGPLRDPDVFPNGSPFIPSKSTSSLIVDVAVERNYTFYMLPGSVITPQLRRFHNEIIENFKKEIQIPNGKLEYQIISLRPGPLIQKPMSPTSPKMRVPSVFVRINITQRNSNIVHPLIIFQMSKCAREGILGDLTISEEIIYPIYVCRPNEVYCLPDCRIGSYCDGISNCPDTKLDEAASCPPCLYKHVTIVPSSNLINEDEDLVFNCNFNTKCENITPKIRWSFPPQLKSFQQLYEGKIQVRSLPQHLVSSGIYRCTIDGEMSSINISVIKKPIVNVTKAGQGADTVIISEIEGSNVDYWCNTTNGLALWASVDLDNVKISNYNERCSKISFPEITKHLAGSYHCNVVWGTQKSRVIKKTVKVVVMCDTINQFQCKQQSTHRSCIPLNQKCDSIEQCSDGSDEADCNICPEKDLSIDVGQKISRDVGDTVFIECLTSNPFCKPLRWWNNGKIIVKNKNIVQFNNFIFIVDMRTQDRGLYQCSDSANRSFVGVFVHINAGPIMRLSSASDVINITHGQSHSVNCIADYPMNVTYKKIRPYWTKQNDNSLPIGVDTISKGETETQIIFNRAHLSMSGEYQCQVTWGKNSGKVVRLSTRINISPLVCTSQEKMCVDQSMCLDESLWCDGNTQCQDGSDERLCDRCKNGYVYVQPPSVTVLVGQNVELHCYYHKDCTPVKWRIVDSDTPRVLQEGFNNSNSNLNLINVGLEASKIYECYSGSKYSRSNVTVLRAVELKVADYAFMDYGQNINVDCQSNYGEPRWRRRDLRPLSEISGAHESHPNPHTTKLSISSPTYDSRGYYVCFVRLSNKEEVTSLTFVHINDLVCPVDHIICDEKTKCISKDKLCDQINDCKSAEDERNCSKCKYDLEIRPKELIITKLGYGIFECIVSNEDCLPIEWKFKSQSTIMRSPPFYKYKTSLYILSPQSNDAGQISCSSGPKTSSANLIVKDLTLSFEPNYSNNTSINIIRGGSQRITCRSSLGTPHWISPEESSVSMYGVRYVNGQENSAVMEIENAHSGASRKYECFVSYSREKKKIFISFDVV